MSDLDRVVADLDSARARTLALTDLDEAELVRQHDPLMSPLVWDLAHVGQQEELWLLRHGDPRRPGLLPPDIDSLYDAFKHPRAERPSLPLLPPVEARRYCAEVRGRVIDALDRIPGKTPDALFPPLMVVQHEQQHDETMLATLQLRRGAPVLVPAAVPPGRRLDPDRVLVAGGPFVLGVDAADEPVSLDNERPAHVVDVPPFWIGRAPVTNGQWLQFIADGGYDRSDLWSAAGWRHRVEADLRRPMFWSDGNDAVLRFGVDQPLVEDEPVQHISFYEAEAFARWAGGRLPTEIEWEKACAWDPGTGRRRRWPWGDAPPTATRANLGGAALRPAPVGAYPAGASAYGVEQMIGDVWEWTSSFFRPWPGFRPMLYRQYSEPFFGTDYRVLRGGSWAVGASAVRPSFRNWDYPIRRQIFTGVRVAWDV
jgi:iron(II)-dependent oxidoreductase